MRERWIIIPNWTKYQERSDRSLPWFKVYYALSRHDKWCSLSLAQRGLLVSLWLEYGPSKGQLRTSNVSARITQKARRETLDSLVEAGFIELSAAQPPELHDALEERREEVDKKRTGDLPKSRKARKDTAAKARRWIDNTVHELAEVPDVERVIADEFEIEDEEVVSDLVAYATERMKSL